jgi:hypothetical protein
VVLAGAAVGAAVAYVAWSALRTDPAPALAAKAEITAATARKPFLVYQHVARDSHYAEIVVAPVHAPRAKPTFTGLVCERVYFAAGRGLCLRQRHNVLGQSVEARIVGADFREVESAQLDGLRSRARVSPRGRYGAATTFVTGHSYQDDGFSTFTALLDMRSGKVLANLEEFEVTRNGERIKAIDFNFWGVTFNRDERRFYATLSTAGEFYLVEGDVVKRRMRVIADRVECPSLSPDGTRVAFKRRQGNRFRLHVLDLATRRVTALAESRSVDDQVEWLDNRRILYGLIKDIWVVRADGGGRPRLYVRDALSPAVVRT